MAALSADRIVQTIAGDTKRGDGLAAAGNTIYKGAMLVWNSSGTLEPATDAVAKTFAGFAVRNNSASYAVTATTAATDRPEYETGKVWVADTAAAQTDVNLLFYALNDNSLVVTATSVKKVLVGRCVDYKLEDGLKWRLIDTSDTSVTTGA